MSDSSDSPAASRDASSRPAAAPGAGEVSARPRIGLVYESFGAYPLGADAPIDAEVEYEPERTIECVEAAFARLGCESVRLGTPHALLAAIAASERPEALPPLAAALCTAEGFGGRNREAWGPVLLEMAGVPMLGSDALTLSLSLDKAWTHRHMAAAGVAVPPHAVFDDPEEARTAPLPAAFPLFVKPRWEGTAKGIRTTSRVADRAALAREVERVARDYRQPALVEAFLPGAEYTVTVVGHDPPRALPVLQRALDRETGVGFHALATAYARDEAGRVPVTPGVLDEPLEKELQALALRVFAALECRDFARLDFKCDASGAPYFLEINTLPTFDPEASFGILAELEGRPPEALLAEVFAEALGRLGLSLPVEGASP